jgi:hypothetical protein
MGRIRPMAAVPRAWRPASGARGGLSDSRPTVEAVRPASVRPAAEAVRRLTLAGAARTGCAVTVCAARAASDDSSVDGARQGRRRKHPRSAAKAPGKRKRGGAHPSGGLT